MDAMKNNKLNEMRNNKLDEMRNQRAMNNLKVDMAEQLVEELLLPNLSEDARTEFEIMKTGRQLDNAITDLVEEVALVNDKDYSFEAKREVLEYLTLILDGFKTYTQSVKEQLRNRATEKSETSETENQVNAEKEDA